MTTFLLLVLPAYSYDNFCVTCCFNRQCKLITKPETFILGIECIIVNKEMRVQNKCNANISSEQKFVKTDYNRSVYLLLTNGVLWQF